MCVCVFCRPSTIYYLMDSIKLPSDLFKCCQIGASVITPVPGLNCGNACGVCVVLCVHVCVHQEEGK